jgi:hypothetical protein
VRVGYAGGELISVAAQVGERGSRCRRARGIYTRWRARVSIETAEVRALLLVD